MEALNLVSESKNNYTKISRRNQVEKYAQLSESELIKLFPLPRYFQIHFQHVHENTEAMKNELAELQQTTLQLNAKIDLLLQLLTTQAHI